MTNNNITDTIYLKGIYEEWLERMSLKFLEHPDNEVILFLDTTHSNLTPIMIETYGLKRVIIDLTKTIDSLR
jgi:hypothetical protein